MPPEVAPDGRATFTPRPSASECQNTNSRSVLGASLTVSLTITGLKYRRVSELTLQISRRYCAGPRCLRRLGLTCRIITHAPALQMYFRGYRVNWLATVQPGLPPHAVNRDSQRLASYCSLNRRGKPPFPTANQRTVSCSFPTSCLGWEGRTTLNVQLQHSRSGANLRRR